MFYRPPEFVVDPENPFANDKLKREPHIRNLTNLMKDSETPLVMTVSASWGSGKTSFIKMWEAHLRTEDGGGHSCIRFDAWQHDFNKEPLLAIMGELGEFIEGHKTRFEKTKSAFHKAVAELPDLLQAMSGALTIASFVNPLAAAPAIACDTLGKAAGKITNYAEKGHATLKSQLDDFKKNIQEVINIVTCFGETPLYFFIDELDRCEPHYAIKLLEALKHFFDLNGIIFVLAIDRERLAGIVEKRYGKGVDELGYLKRFVDVNYTIPEPPYEEFINHIAFDFLKLDQHPIATGDMKKHFLESSVKLAEAIGMKARDIEKAFVKGYPVLIKQFSISHLFDLTEEGLKRIEVGQILSKGKGQKQIDIDRTLLNSTDNFFIIPLSVLFLTERGIMDSNSLKTYNFPQTNPTCMPIRFFISPRLNGSYNLKKWPWYNVNTETRRANLPSQADESISERISERSNSSFFIDFIFNSIKHYRNEYTDDISNLTENETNNFYEGIDFPFFP